MCGDVIYFSWSSVEGRACNSNSECFEGCACDCEVGKALESSAFVAVGLPAFSSVAVLGIPPSVSICW